MKRAIVIYLENNKQMMYQMGCFYYAWKYLNSRDTDLVVFGMQDALDRVPDDCIKVLYTPISKESEWNNYYFIDSMSCLTSPQADFLEQYDCLLRSDADTFLTPAWNHFYPLGYVTGGGKYVHDDNTKNNLIRVANTFGLKHKGIHNIGSTHYGPASIVREVCRLVEPITKYLVSEEFKYDKGKWPGWTAPVSLLYASEIAVNHLINNPKVEPQTLDFESHSSDSVFYHPHIHCWHTGEKFSKFCFLVGGYDNVDIRFLNRHKVNDYCTYTALMAKRDLPEFFK